MHSAWSSDYDFDAEPVGSAFACALSQLRSVSSPDGLSEALLSDEMARIAFTKSAVTTATQAVG